MKQYEIAAMGKSELLVKVEELENRLADINFYKAIELPQNPMVFRNSKREIARMKTRIRQIEMQESSQA